VGRRCLAALVLAAGLCGAAAALPVPTAARLPRWRGFNLPDLVSADGAPKGFREDDFRLIATLGFDFVRLPLDYRLWIVGGDWARIDGRAFAAVDEALRWGEKYGIHVCLALHRAPGYCVNPPREPRDLFADREAQRVCALHWAFIARRYRGIPSSRLSFNLLNEPGEVDGPVYARVVRVLCDGIRREDPDRLIIADAPAWGTRPCPELIPLGAAQAARGYGPLQLTHWCADWIEGSGAWPVPSWPPLPVSGWLYGPEKPAFASALVAEGPFDLETRIAVRVAEVSLLSRLRVRADGRVILDRALRPGPGQDLRGLEVGARIPAGTRRLEIDNAEGDWMTFSEIVFTQERTGRTARLLPAELAWGSRQGSIRADLDSDRPFTASDPAAGRDAVERMFEPFVEIGRRGVGIMVGEFGAHNLTPHPVVLAWMKDCLETWERAGWGWALWNFRGDFGIIDSGRSDVDYEAWEGHALDRAMLELLQGH
jgi:hypothetical protein